MLTDHNTKLSLINQQRGPFSVLECIISDLWGDTPKTMLSTNSLKAEISTFSVIFLNNILIDHNLVLLIKGKEKALSSFHGDICEDVSIRRGIRQLAFSLEQLPQKSLWRRERANWVSPNWVNLSYKEGEWTPDFFYKELHCASLKLSLIPRKLTQSNPALLHLVEWTVERIGAVMDMVDNKEEVSQ